MKIQEFIKIHLKNRLNKDISLVIYDPEELYRSIVEALASDVTTVIDGGNSTILGREDAMEVWCRLGKTDGEDSRLVVYLPVKRPSNERERQKNPYQVFALGGGEFPDGDGESYQALCRQATPDLSPQVDKLFESDIPEFNTVNNLIAGKASWPTLKTLLDAESAAEILTTVMSPTKKQKGALIKSSTWVSEIKQFLSAVLDYPLKTKSEKLSTISNELWRFILFSEFALDMPVGIWGRPLKYMFTNESCYAIWGICHEKPA